jgi:hypothetical protein
VSTKRGGSIKVQVLLFPTKKEPKARTNKGDTESMMLNWRKTANSNFNLDSRFSDSAAQIITLEKEDGGATTTTRKREGRCSEGRMRVKMFAGLSVWSAEGLVLGEDEGEGLGRIGRSEGRAIMGLRSRAFDRSLQQQRYWTNSLFKQ